MSSHATLYHAPFTCSLAVQLAASWGDVPLNIAPLNLATKQLAKGGDLHTINPTGQVSTLRLPDGTILTETSACLVWIQSQSHNAQFHRAADTAEYFQMLRWIGFCATELHKQGLRIVFYDEATEPVKDRFRELVAKRLAVLDTHLSGRKHLVGNALSAADAYLIWFLTLAPRADLRISDHLNLSTYAEHHLSNTVLTELLSDDKDLKLQLTDMSI